QGTANLHGEYEVTVTGGKATLVLDGNLAGTETWTATYTVGGGTPISDDLAVTWSPGAVASVQLMARKTGTSGWNFDEFVVNWNDSIDIRVQLNDAKGNPITGQPVTIQTIEGTAHHGQPFCGGEECVIQGTTGGTGGTLTRT